jgi:osmotically-inducible protein OsmY
VEALERRAVHWAEHLEIMVHNGTVTLAGQVRSGAEKHAILGAVGHTPGVAAVTDQLRV